MDMYGLCLNYMLTVYACSEQYVLVPKQGDFHNLVALSQDLLTPLHRFLKSTAKPGLNVFKFRCLQSLGPRGKIV